MGAGHARQLPDGDEFASGHLAADGAAGDTELVGDLPSGQRVIG